MRPNTHADRNSWSSDAVIHSEEVTQALHSVTAALRFRIVQSLTNRRDE
jgi:hypothetical protein